MTVSECSRIQTVHRSLPSPDCMHWITIQCTAVHRELVEGWLARVLSACVHIMNLMLHCMSRTCVHRPIHLLHYNVHGQHILHPVTNPYIVPQDGTRVSRDPCGSMGGLQMKTIDCFLWGRRFQYIQPFYGEQCLSLRQPRLHELTVHVLSSLNSTRAVSS